MPRIVDHDQRRDELAQVAFRLFADEGYADTGMRRLASAAGVSTGTLYHYFPDKPSILTHMFGVVVGQDVARFGAELPGDAPTQVRLAALLGYVERNSDHLRDVIRVALEVHRHEPSAQSHAEVKRGLRLYREAVAGTLGLNDGPAARVAFSYIIGSLLHELLDPGEADLATLIPAWSELWKAAFGGGPDDPAP